jgi:thiosulfate/3-mercaptopyruvate sulfurtransferase
VSSILISAEELMSRLADGDRTRILDVRWRLDRPDGRPEYLAGHIPGAVYVSLDDDLSAHGEPTDGRHPLPDAAQLQASAQRWGIDDGDTVVVYDDLGSMSASRAWWVLTDAGVADVRILDGALRGWVDAGGALENGEPSIPPGNVTLTSGALARMSIDDAAAVAADGVLLDVRAPERYRGDVEPIDPRAGHIPGAVNLPTAGNNDETGRFLAADALRERFSAAGVADDAAVGAYCGSGVAASHTYVALTLAGFSPQLYPGSWSQWSNHPERPVATGDVV